MRKNSAARILAFILFCGMSGQAFAADKLIVYTSMKELLIGRLSEAFVKANPGTAMDYQSAGAGKLMAKIAAERESGKILADVIWTSEVPDFYKMREDGILEKYVPAAAKEALNPFDDYDGSFTAARLGTLGIAYNTKLIKTAPTSWSDLTKPEYKGAFGIANPALSGTSYMSVALLARQFGWEFFDKLYANGAKIGKGSGQVIDDTASGDLAASLAVDYITFDKISKGAPLALAYPKETLVVPSPIAIIKNSPNMTTAKKFLDFLLSKEAQTIGADEGTLPVRADVTVPARYNIPAPADAMKRAMKVNYMEMIAAKEKNVKQFTDAMQGKK
ncbi:MAG: ABC transporter substrate-binding protein [Deltaproteobacteria bacterium]|nr:ABC transporter substrate-binding protein [Deltaproteobacteria bacterium]